MPYHTRQFVFGDKTCAELSAMCSPYHTFAAVSPASRHHDDRSRPIGHRWRTQRWQQSYRTSSNIYVIECGRWLSVLASSLQSVYIACSKQRCMRIRGCTRMRFKNLLTYLLTYCNVKLMGVARERCRVIASPTVWFLRFFTLLELHV